MTTLKVVAIADLIPDEYFPSQLSALSTRPANASRYPPYFHGSAGPVPSHRIKQQRRREDYSFGQAVARAARAMLAQKRPDITIVDDDLHPLGKVKDFSPYIAKVRSAGADAIITGNWGNDFTLLVKAAKDAGLSVDYYTYYAGSPGMLTTLGEGAMGHIKNVHVYNANPTDERGLKYLVHQLGRQGRWQGSKVRCRPQRDGLEGRATRRR